MEKSESQIFENDDEADELKSDSSAKDASYFDARSFIQCFCVVARHKEVDISPERLTHDYDIRAERLPFRNIKQIIEDQNFAVKLKKPIQRVWND